MSGDLSPVKVGTTEPFRRLSKNDIYQTTEQWRERTIMRLGEVSGQWAAWVDTDQVPSVPSVRPQPPIKPSSEALMLHLKNELRAQRLRELNEREAKAKAAEGKAPEPKTLEDVQYLFRETTKSGPNTRTLRTSTSTTWRTTNALGRRHSRLSPWKTAKCSRH